MNTIRLYQERYEKINFERLGLFRLLRAQVGDVPVVYIGSSIHISPSVIFSQVCYCDNSQESRGFFSDISKVQEYASSRREYAQKPHIEFLPWNYQTPPPKNLLPAGLVISIYSPDGFQPAARMVREGGFLLYQPLPAELYYSGNSCTDI